MSGEGCSAIGRAPVAQLPAWRAHGLSFAINRHTGQLVDAGRAEDRDLMVARLNYTEGVTVEQLRELRDANVTPLHILAAVAMQGVGATVVRIADRLARRAAR